jgi:hypothetical protein
MKVKLLLCLLCFFSLAISTIGQTKKPQKPDELTVLDCEALKLRSFNLMTDVEKNPYSRGYLIN